MEWQKDSWKKKNKTKLKEKKMENNSLTKSGYKSVIYNSQYANLIFIISEQFNSKVRRSITFAQLGFKVSPLSHYKEFMDGCEKQVHPTLEQIHMMS